MSKGLMLVISGPAGSGKGTVVSHLVKNDDFVCSVSATTRPPRPLEVDGVNYHFLTKEAFEKRIAEGGMLEYTQYCGNYYGTPKKEAQEVLSEGKNLILEIEVEGAANIKKQFPEAVLIMLLPPSFAVQEARLRGRGTEDEEKIQNRLERTRQEIATASIYDYVVFNRDGADIEAAKDIAAIVRAEKCAMSRNTATVGKYFD